MIGKLIDQWLKAGVMEDGPLSYRDEGTPQGGVVFAMDAKHNFCQAVPYRTAREVSMALDCRLMALNGLGSNA